MPTFDRAAATEAWNARAAPRTKLRPEDQLREENEKLKALYEQLAESCKEAIDGDITEAEKQIKHLKQKNKELQNDLNKLVALSESTFNEYKEGFEDLKTLAQDKHDSLQTYINTLQTYIKENEKLKAENEELKEENEESVLKRNYQTHIKNKIV